MPPLVLVDHVNAKPMKSDDEIKSTSEDFSLKADITKIEKHELLTLPNQRYDQILEKCWHLNGVKFNDRQRFQGAVSDLSHLGCPRICENKNKLKTQGWSTRRCRSRADQVWVNSGIPGARC